MGSGYWGEAFGAGSTRTRVQAHTGRQAGRQTNRQTDKQAGRQTDSQTNRQAGRQADTHARAHADSHQVMSANAIRNSWGRAARPTQRTRAFWRQLHSDPGPHPRALRRSFTSGHGRQRDPHLLGPLHEPRAQLRARRRRRRLRRARRRRGRRGRARRRRVWWYAHGRRAGGAGLSHWRRRLRRGGVHKRSTDAGAWPHARRRVGARGWVRAPRQPRLRPRWRSRGFCGRARINALFSHTDAKPRAAPPPRPARRRARRRRATGYRPTASPPPARWAPPPAAWFQA